MKETIGMWLIRFAFLYVAHEVGRYLAKRKFDKQIKELDAESRKLFEENVVLTKKLTDLGQKL